MIRHKYEIEEQVYCLGKITQQVCIKPLWLVSRQVYIMHSTIETGLQVN